MSWDDAVLETQDGLEYAGHACTGLQVAEIGLDTADLEGGLTLTVDFADRTDLNGVS
jgi:hypothetical protein